MGGKWVMLFILVLASAAVASEVDDLGPTTEEETSGFRKVLNFLWVADGSSYHHVWPPMEFGWKLVLGSLIGFFGAAFGSVGGVGGGGIFVPMLALIIGFDPKSSTAISKCMITGAAVSTVYYNLRLRHPTIDMPIIDYNLAVLIQPMLVLGISIGVIFNVVFPDWMVTILLICIFMITSTKAFFKGVETWKKETILKKEAARRAENNDGPSAVEYRPIPTGPNDRQEIKTDFDSEVPIIENVYWKELCLLVFVWMAFLVVQIVKQIWTCKSGRANLDVHNKSGSGQQIWIFLQKSAGGGARAGFRQVAGRLSASCRRALVGQEGFGNDAGGCGSGDAVLGEEEGGWQALGGDSRGG